MMPRAFALALMLLSAPHAAADVAATVLAPPTSVRYGDEALYDIVDASVLGGDRLRLRVEMGAIDPVGGLPIGITQPILELYLDSSPGGAVDLLPGSGMQMPAGEGWNVAVRITGDGAWAWLADETGVVDLADAIELDAVASGRTIDVITPFAPVEVARLYAISGVYDPFRVDGWRPTSRTATPWAFSSAEPSLPVVDVFPVADVAARARSLAEGVLPRRATSGIDVRTTLWIAVMLAGLGLAIAGLWWRRGTPTTVVVVPRTVTEEEATLAAAVRAASIVPPIPPRAPPGGVASQGRPIVDPNDELLIGESEMDAVLARLSGGLEPAEGLDPAIAQAPTVAPAVAPAAPRLALPAPDPFGEYESATRAADEAEGRDDDRLESSRR
ncbi:MAG: hypothetical protein H0U69_03955 [Trueperaceae bacterium]|nr:hypothetical protein [Trueperaceae bacterium]